SIEFLIQQLTVNLPIVDHAGAPQKVKLVDRGKRSAIIFCRMRVLHKTCYVPLSTGQVTAHPPTRKQH
ncbi:hypothetical protein QU862_33580, partial [Escherichia coli]|nr:hypothetical protein [Escherichia coli]